jgi:hypothetical protein
MQEMKCVRQMKHAISLIALLLAGCSGLFDAASREEVAWANAPDRRTHAILLETNGGATTSFGYIVELHPAGHQGETPVNAGSLYGATRSECAYGVDLRWLDPSILELRYESAKQVSVPKSVIVGGRRIHIVTHGGRVNTAAPCGGMLASRPELNGG